MEIRPDESVFLTDTDVVRSGPRGCRVHLPFQLLGMHDSGIMYTCTR